MMYFDPIPVSYNEGGCMLYNHARGMWLPFLTNRSIFIQTGINVTPVDPAHLVPFNSLFKDRKEIQ